jgi:medium-chain acyl-[acyl-carrier-protein] hydrolase
MGPDTNRWLAYRHELPDARLRLFCLGGGGASMFSLWDQGMPAGVEVCPLQPPGREDRLGEPPMIRIPQVVASLSEALAPLLDRPFALFGHSVGAVSVFELARELRRQGSRSPEWLFTSGHPAPDLPYRRPIVSHLAQPEFWQAMQDHFDIDPVLLENEDLKALLYPALRAEHELEETYVYTEEAPLDIPLSAFGGSRDLETTEAELLAWGKHTTNRFKGRILEGNHMFVTAQREALVDGIAQDLSALLGTAFRS